MIGQQLYSVQSTLPQVQHVLGFLGSSFLLDCFLAHEIAQDALEIQNDEGTVHLVHSSFKKLALC